MTQLHQETSAIAATTKLTSVIWFKMNSFTTVPFNIFYPPFIATLGAWGYQSTPNGDGNGNFAEGFGMVAITYNHISDPNFVYLGFAVQGQQFPPSGLGGPHFTNSPNSQFLPLVRGNGVYPRMELVARIPLANFDLNGWHIIWSAIDKTTPDTFDFGTGTYTQKSKAGLLIDGVLYRATSFLVGIGGMTTRIPSDTDQTPGTVGLYETTPPADITEPNPTWNIQILGSEFAYPIITTSDKDSNNSIIYNFDNCSLDVSYGTVQMWANQYIDPGILANRPNFYNLVNNELFPVGGKLAVDAFGNPDIWFERDSVSDLDFQTNGGSAGNFTIVGTPPADFNPTPSDDPPPVP